MTCKICGSYAINHHCHGRDGSQPDLCDVCFWRDKHDAQGLVLVTLCDMVQGEEGPRDNASLIRAVRSLIEHNNRL